MLRIYCLRARKNPTKCLIFDDTDIAKTGKTIEGVSKIFNHVNKIFHFGFKLFVAGYWNGSIFIPVDFSFHSSLSYLTAKAFEDFIFMSLRPSYFKYRNVECLKMHISLFFGIFLVIEIKSDRLMGEHELKK